MTNSESNPGSPFIGAIGLRAKKKKPFLSNYPAASIHKVNVRQETGKDLFPKSKAINGPKLES